VINQSATHRQFSLTKYSQADWVIISVIW
jgi:hypothetical protein